MTSTEMPPLLKEGIDLFNSGKFFECHEVLEHLWNQQPEPEKQFTQGLIQIAVATYHLLNSNWIGAEKLYVKGLRRVSAFAPQHYGLNVSVFITESERLLEAAKSQTIPSTLPKIL